MKKILITNSFIALVFAAIAQDLSYYLPTDVTYNPAIPVPKDIIYHNVGEWHVTHDRLVNYMKAVAAAAPDRIRLETMGFTYEDRPQLMLIITSPKNHERLEEIRQHHILLTDPSKSATLNTSNMPIVVWIGHSIHGNESSGANASLLGAYYLAAAQGKKVDELLDNVVILFDPSFNPDGLQRFSGWVNQNKSKNLVSDPNDREYNEVWPGGRYNHYWFDLNRDWLPAVHKESQNRLAWFHKWKPNILTDHHEQGSNNTFFFQPGVASRVNPLTPEKNQDLTAKLAEFHARYLDSIGSLYFTRENYDDFYYGKGSTYPDVNGAIGILFEQASSRGHLQETENGLLSFPFTIKNQFTTELSTLEGAKVLRKDFLDWQREFYQTAMKEAAVSTIKGYIFGGNADKTKAAIFTEMLLRHQVAVYDLTKKISIDGNNFSPENTYVVPLNQPQERLIKAIFNKTLDYKDSLFYDITAWTMPLAYGLPYSELYAAQMNEMLLNDKIKEMKYPAGKLNGKSGYAYLLEWGDFNTPKALYTLLKAGVILKVANTTFTMQMDDGEHFFDYGTIMIPVTLQNINSDELYTLMKSTAEQSGVEIYGVSTGKVKSGSDLGSRNFSVVDKPAIAMIVGTGTNATDAGEVWHLLDQRFNIPSTHLEQYIFNRADLNKYNTIIMVGGRYTELNKDKLKEWVQAGGTLILTEEAVQWAAQAGINQVNLRKPKSVIDSIRNAVYADLDQVNDAQQMRGAIFGADVDLTHPLAYGYHQKTLNLFKANTVFMEKSKNPFASPFLYGNKPLQSGWLSQQNYTLVKNSAAVIVNTVDKGRVINIADNPNFRAFWLGGSKLFMNAIFFGKIIDAGSGRTDD